MLDLVFGSPLVRRPKMELKNISNMFVQKKDLCKIPQMLNQKEKIGFGKES